MGSRIVGTGRALPQACVSNHDLSRRIETSDEWIRSRTGIERRYLIKSTESLVDIAAQSSRQALERASIAPSEIDAIICGTVSSDYAFPSFGCQLQNALGIDSVPAFDVAAACSGFVYALAVADNGMRAGNWNKTLVVGADALSTMVDWQDRRTAVLFGDGAGAVVMATESGNRGVIDTLLRSSGNQADLLSAKATGIRCTADAEVRRSPDDALQMKGPELFKVAVKSMADITRSVVERAGLALSDIDVIVPHQANIRIIDAVADRLDL